MKVIGILIGSLIMIAFSIILTTLLGALVGWVVGLFFGETILGIFSQIGINNISMWDLGAFLGFVGGFFRSVQNG